MFDHKQAMDNIFLQIKVYGQNGTKIISHSLIVKRDNYAQQILAWRGQGESESQDQSVIIFRIGSNQTLKEKSKIMSDTELLKAYQTIGNSAVREHNAKIELSR